MRICSMSMLVLSALLLAACATTREELSRSIANSIVDSFMGYRIQYESIPAGATVSCGGANLGVTPFAFYREPTAQEKSSQIMRVDSCGATWPSGAYTAIRADVPLAQYPTFVRLTAERPQNVAGYKADEVAGEALLAKRQQEYEDIQKGLRHLVNVGVGIRQMTKSSPAPTEPTLSSFSSSFKGAQVTGGIRWNWVHSGTMSHLAQASQTTNRSLTPLLPASSCMGFVVLGRCNGTVEPTAKASYCAGSFVNGQCLGSVIGD